MASPKHSNQDSLQLRIEGMTCGGCVARVERCLRRVPGVRDVRVNLSTETATVDLSESPASRRDLLSAIREAGYDAEPIRTGDVSTLSSLAPDRAFEGKLREQRQALIQAIGLALPIIAIHWFGGVLRSSSSGGHLWPLALQAILTLVLLLSPAAAPILVGGLQALIHRAGNMDLLIAMGVTVAFLSGVGSLLRAAHHHAYFHAAAMIIAFINVGRYFEAKAKRSASSAVAALAKRTPTSALLIADGETREVPTYQLQPGDEVRCPADTVIPVDGVITQGEGAIDESSVTGEATPRYCKAGDRVLSGTLVTEGLISLRATQVGEESSLGRIARAVEQAQSGKTKMQRLADRVAGVFVPIVIVLAITTFVGTLFSTELGTSEAINRAIAVLVIACPCAMGLATPTAILVATGTAALQGILIRDAASLEAAGQIDCMFLDKTGTLTTGKPRVQKVTGTKTTETEKHLLQLAASAEQYSQHPFAAAIVQEAKQRGLTLLEPQSFANKPGQGVQACIDGKQVLVGSSAFLKSHDYAVQNEPQAGVSCVFVGFEGCVVGYITLTDEVRPEAVEAISGLRRLGVSTVMLTGDQEAAARCVADVLGIERVGAAMTPQAKADQVAQKKSAGGRAAFVGDGINDAPALAAADVGFTFASASDAAIGAADITIVHNDLTRLVSAVQLARRSVRIIKQNLFWAFFYNFLAIPLAATGRVSPGIAAAAMMFSSISVVINSLRLRSFRN